MLNLGDGVIRAGKLTPKVLGLVQDGILDFEHVYLELLSHMPQKSIDDAEQILISFANRDKELA